MLPHHVAAKESHNDVIQLLLDHGTRIDNHIMDYAIKESPHQWITDWETLLFIQKQKGETSLVDVDQRSVGLHYSTLRTQPSCSRDKERQLGYTSRWQKAKRQLS